MIAAIRLFLTTWALVIMSLLGLIIIVLVGVYFIGWPVDLNGPGELDFTADPTQPIPPEQPAVAVQQPTGVVIVVTATPAPTVLPYAPTAQPVVLTQQSAAPATTGPTESFCQLGVVVQTSGIPSQSLDFDGSTKRGYMNDRLAVDIQKGTAYCKVVFAATVTLLIDSVAAKPLKVNGQVVSSGNGLIYTGSIFEFVYPFASVSNGHAYIIQ